MGFKNKNKKVKEEEVIAEATFTEEVKETFEFNKEDINVMVDFIYERIPESIKSEDKTKEESVKEFIDYINIINN